MCALDLQDLFLLGGFCISMGVGAGRSWFQSESDCPGAFEQSTVQPTNFLNVNKDTMLCRGVILTILSTDNTI